MITKKVHKLCSKCEGYDNSFNSWIDKTQYKTWVSIFMKHLIDKNVEVEMGLSN